MATTFKKAAGLCGVGQVYLAKLTDNWPEDLGDISEALVNAGMKAGPGLLRTAKAINEYRPAQQQPAAPLQVSFVDPNDLSEVTLEVLLQKVVADPRNKRLRAELGTRDEYIGATFAAGELIGVLTPDWRNLDVEKTIEYWVHLDRGGSKLSKYKDQLVVTLAQALGLEKKSLARPDPLGSTQSVVNRIDPIFGKEWSISDELWAALVWAYTTGHSLWPTNFDRYTSYQELHQRKLNSRWQTILDDYRKHTSMGGAAINLEDPSLLQVINRAQSRTQSPGAHARTGGVHRSGDKKLSDKLAELYPDNASARRVASDAGLKPWQIAFDAQTINSWSAIVKEAERQGRVETLIDVATKTYPGWRDPLMAMAEAEKLI